MSVTCQYIVKTYLTLYNIQTMWYTDRNSLSFLVMVSTDKTSATEAENNQSTYATEAFTFLFAITYPQSPSNYSVGQAVSVFLRNS